MTMERFYNVCCQGNMEKVKEFLKKHNMQCDDGLAGACKGGHRDIIDMMIEHGANKWRWAFENACCGGHLDIIYLIASKDPKDSDWSFGLTAFLNNPLNAAHITLDMVQMFLDQGACDYPAYFINACKRGNLTLAKFFANKIHEQDPVFELTWNRALFGACRKNHIDVVQFLLQNDRSYSLSLLMRCLEQCCDGKNVDIVKLLIAYCVHKSSLCISKLSGAYQSGNVEIIRLLQAEIKDEEIPWDDAFYGACQGGHLELVQRTMQMIEQKEIKCRWHAGFIFTCQFGHLNVAKHLLQCKQLQHQQWNWQMGLEEACLKGHEDMAEFLISHFGRFHVNWNQLLLNACQSPSLNLVKMVNRDNGFAFLDWNIGLQNAYCHKRTETIKWIIENKTDIKYDWNRCLVLAHRYVDWRSDIIKLTIEQKPTNWHEMINDFSQGPSKRATQYYRKLHLIKNGAPVHDLKFEEFEIPKLMTQGVQPQQFGHDVQPFVQATIRRKQKIQRLMHITFRSAQISLPMLNVFVFPFVEFPNVSKLLIRD